MNFIDETLIASMYILLAVGILGRKNAEKIMIIILLFMMNLLSIKLILLSWYYAKWTLIFSGWFGFSIFEGSWTYLTKDGSRGKSKEENHSAEEERSPYDSRRRI
ncbi:MAG: hypothetical protein Q4A78_07260 [Peptostreptococcaceae bacterium]|nr:hypothetical protein [Peptostreptococcaceae bacterium]